MGVWEQWVIDVKESLNAAPAVLEKEVFYDVPSCLKNDQTRDFYHPKQISFGPRHFQLSKRTENLVVSENFKSEVASTFEHLKGGVMESLVGNFKKNMARLEKNYGIEIIYRYPDEDRPAGLSWMLARDGCFLLEVLDGFQDEISPQGQREGTGMSEGVEMTVLQRTPKRDNQGMTVLQHILKRDNHHPLLTEIVKDMFKLENQLPLWVLLETLRALRMDVDAYRFEPALKFLSPIEVNVEACSQTYENKIHILQLLGEYMIDHKIDRSPSTREENPQSEADHTSLLPGSTWSHVKRILKKCFRCIITKLRAVFVVIFVLLLSPVLLVLLIVWSVRESYQIFFRGTAEDDRHVPTIEELHSIGVKFKSLKGKGISHIHFNERKSTLYLPKFTVNDGSEVILRNLLAMETQWEEEEKIITRYGVFMNDLVNTSVDVARLRRRGIIANKLGSDEDVARLWNSVTVPVTDIPHYDPIDKVSRSINAYRKKWCRVLWAQFWSLHCSKPWLLASLVGGITLLWLTVFQVICLFNSCSKSGIHPME